MRSAHEIVEMAKITRYEVDTARKQNLAYLQGHMAGRIDLLCILRLITYEEAKNAKKYLASVANNSGMTTHLML